MVGTLYNCLFQGDKRAILLAIWEAYQDCDAERKYAEDNGLGFEWFCDQWKAADVVGAMVDGQLAGGMMFEGGDVHIAIRKEFWSRWFRCFEPMIEWGFALHGPHLKAIMHRDNTRGIQFAERVGAIRVGEDDDSVSFLVIKDKMYYAKRRERLQKGNV